MAVNPQETHALADRLDAVFAPADIAFLATGDGLGRAADLLRSLDEGFDALRLACEGDDVLAASALLQEMAQALPALTDQLGAEAGQIDSLGRALQGVGLHIAAFTRINKAFGMLALNFAVASSALDAAAGEVGAFQAELRRLTSTAIAVADGFAQLHAEASRDLAEVASRQAAFAREQAPRLRELALRIGEGLAAVAVRRQEVGASTVQVQERGQAIAHAISSAVKALQVGDATRQRIEHVVDALRQIADGLGGAMVPWSKGLDATERAALAGRAMELQAAQLADTAATLSAEADSLGEALARLGEEAWAMVEIGTDLFGRGRQQGDVFLTALDRNLKAVAGLLVAAAAGRRGLDASMATIGERMQRLSAGLGAIRDVTIDLHLAGLNAVLRCSRLGDKGRAMAAITLELRDYAKEMATGVDALASALDRSQVASVAILESGGARRAEELEAMVSGLQASLERLGAAGHSTDEAVARLRRDGGEVARILDGMSAGMRPITTLAAELQAAASHPGVARADCPEAGAALLRDRLALVHAIPYTTEKERAIARAHGAVFPEAASAVAAVELDDMLF